MGVVAAARRKERPERLGVESKLIGNPLRGAIGRIEHNMHAHFYCVKSPDGIMYTFRNAAHFVRTHSELFPENSTAPRKANPNPKSIATFGSNADIGLRRLFYEGKNNRAQWRGWQGVWKKDRLGNIVWERK